ncbi:hypothetical protein [Loktanella sp. M215]|uniref:hypothetical protein n=1 Tax=Loktanella sp. M215 TaxID=2675431 RepID=UPI001F335937|nr:hypothetical protein [Loktanella sp. M215]MCF7699864.1 hypothetical protein [Loktanella sp. M215]
MIDDATLWTFARFAPGQHFAPVTVPLDANRVAGWEAIYGAVIGATAPDGMIIAGMMEAYIHAIQPRPKGNVHAGQKIALTGAQVALGQTLTYRVGVAEKAEKKGRHWVTFTVRADHDGTEILNGRIVAIWNA